jgi:hypothetical protein
MKSVIHFLNERVKPGLFALLFITVLLLISIVLERRHIYF